MRCSALADELDEPMAGTVDQRARWLLVEDRSAWDSHAVRDVLGTAFEAAAKQRHLRVLLVRRREGPPDADAVRRVFLVDPVTTSMATRTIDDLAELDIGMAMRASPTSAIRRPARCSSSARTAAATRAVRCVVERSCPALASEDVWECTHLGGHRFAGNLVCLPDAIVYGRVSAADAPGLAAAYRDGRLDLDHLRGRSILPASAQVAEIELRRRLGHDRLRDMELVEAAEGVDDALWAVFRTADGRRETHRLELRPERLAPPRPISCRADDLQEPLHWRVVVPHG